MFASSKAADLNYLEQGGQSYWAFPLYLNVPRILCIHCLKDNLQWRRCREKATRATVDLIGHSVYGSNVICITFPMEAKAITTAAGVLTTVLPQSKYCIRGSIRVASILGWNCHSRSIEYLMLIHSKQVNLANLNCPAIEKPVFGLLLDLLLTGSYHISVFCAAQDILRERISSNKVWKLKIMLQ